MSAVTLEQIFPGGIPEQYRGYLRVDDEMVLDEKEVLAQKMRRENHARTAEAYGKIFGSASDGELLGGRREKRHGGGRNVFPIRPDLKISLAVND